jgi:hypothetical protein
VRLLGRLLLLTLVFTLALWGGRWASERLTWRLVSTPATRAEAELSSAQPSPAHVLGPAWTVFDLLPATRALRVLTNASVPPAVAASGGAWPYALAYEVRDPDDRVLAAGIYHHRAGVVRFSDERAERQRGFYLDEGVVPTDARILLLNLGGLGTPRRLRLRLDQRDAVIAEVVARVYERETLPEHKLRRAWQRLTDNRRRAVTRGSVYGPDLLREDEQLDFLRRVWRPIAPVGIAGQDYWARTLYTRIEPEGERVVAPVAPEGLPAGPALRAVVPLPDQPVLVRLEAEWAAASAAGDGSAQVAWFGNGPGERAVRGWERAVSGSPFVGEFIGGLLEVRATQPMVTRAYREDAPGPTAELTPPPRTLRSFLLDPQHPLEYPVDHLDGAPTPLRVDLRRTLPPAGDPATPPVVRYALLEASGRVRAEGELAVGGDPSLYDRLGGVPPWEGRVSEPASHHFRVPPGIDRLRLVSTGPVLAVGYSRPPGLVREVRVPEDYRPSTDDAGRVPPWFWLRPRDHEPLVRGGRVRLLAVQARPPRDDPELLAGQYQWQVVVPEGAWVGRRLLTPGRADRPGRDEALAAGFHTLEAGREVRLRFAAVDGGSRVAPGLVVLPRGTAPLEVSVTVDGVRVLRERLAGRAAELTLPALPAGEHRLRLDASAPGSWLVSHVAGPPPAMLRRLAVRLGPDGASYLLEKGRTAPEVVTGEVYLAAGHSGRVRLCARLEGDPPADPGPVAEWTFRDRCYDVRSEPIGAVPVLDGGPALGPAQRFFLPLGADLAAGTYRLRVTVEGQDPVHLVLYRVTPGAHEQLRWFREQVLADARSVD